jgi:hypothetical protein
LSEFELSLVRVARFALFENRPNFLRNAAVVAALVGRPRTRLL